MSAKKMESSFCFICLEGLKVKTGRKRKEELMSKKKGESEFNLLMKYSLQTRSKTYDNVFKDILELVGNGHATNKVESKETQVNQLVRLCEKCETIGARVLELHLELEKIQMRIINEVRSVRRAVLNSSGWLGGIGNEDGSEAEGFKQFLKRICGEVISSKKQKELYKVLKAFQTAVTEIDGDSVHMPLVYLDNYKIAVPAENPNIFLRTVPDIVSKPVDTESFQNIVKGSDTGSDFYEELCQEDGEEAPTVKKQFETIPSKSSALTRNRTQTQPMEIKSEFDLHLESDDGEESEENSLAKSTPSGRRPKQTMTVRKELRNKRRAERRLRAKQGWSKPVKLLQMVSGRYYCASCDFSCKFLGRFEQHLREHETDEKEFHCDKCNVGFTNQQLYFLHQNRHEGFNKFKCDVCRSYIDAFDFSTHLKTHVEEVFPCPYCSYCSSSRDKHLIHIDVVHAKVDVTCDICGESFEAKRLLMEHLLSDHKVIEKNVKCDFEGCNKTFISMRALCSHRNIHTDRYACKACHKRFSSIMNLRAHARVHHGQVQEKPIKCDQCPEAFASVPKLQTHLIRDHGAPKLECNVCSKKYLTRPALRLHMGKEHNIGLEKYCTICNKNFAIPSKLRLHMERCHSKGPNYVCEKCGKTFLSSEGYNNHKKIHGEKTQKCPFCPKAFAQDTILRQHMKTHTNETRFA